MSYAHRVAKQRPYFNTNACKSALRKLKSPYIIVIMLKDKGMLIGIVATVVLIGLGIFFFTKPSSPAQPKKVSQEILVPKDDYITGGIANGIYLPATSSAQITLVEFGDYECPACGEYDPLVKQLLTDMAGKINFVFRNFPLSQHSNAQASAQAAEAAGLQGKYWQMHDKLYETQNEWAALSDPATVFIGYAQGLGLNIDQFKTDMNSSKVKDKIAADYNDGTLININATPTFYVNGVQVTSLPASYGDFKNTITSMQ